MYAAPTLEDGMKETDVAPIAINSRSEVSLLLVQLDQSIDPLR